VEAGGQGVSLRLKPGRGQPRDVAVLVRPHGVPIWLSGRRGGRALRGGDIRMAASGTPAKGVPFALPDVEDVHGLFSPPPAGVPGVAVWITPLARSEAPQFDAEARQRLKVLGYLR